MTSGAFHPNVDGPNPPSRFDLLVARARRAATLADKLARNAIRRPRRLALELERALERISADPPAMPLREGHPHAASEVAAAGPPHDFAMFDVMPMCAPLNITATDVDGDAPHLNIVLPGVKMAAMSGGPNTALAIGYRLAEMGVPIRFISANAPPDADHAPLFDHFMKISGVSRRLENVSIIDAHDRTKRHNFGRNDLFFATAWWTAQMVRRIIPGFRNSKFIYLVQDFEPGLHEFSSYYALAMETYELDFLPVVNHPILADHFLAERVGQFAKLGTSRDLIILDPAIDRAHFYPAPKAPGDRKRLLFYARPSVAKRNMFELGVIALRKAVASGLFEDGAWDFIGMGEPFTPVALGGGRVLECAPWLGFHSYAEQMRSADLLLSLMFAPHPSYPPLEMAACGGVAVTNEFGVKTAARLAEISGNIFAGPATVEGVVECLTRAMAFLPNTDQRLHNASSLRAPGAWAESFSKVIPPLYDFWRAAAGR